MQIKIEIYINGSAYWLQWMNFPKDDNDPMLFGRTDTHEPRAIPGDVARALLSAFDIIKPKDEKENA